MAPVLRSQAVRLVALPPEIIALIAAYLANVWDKWTVMAKLCRRIREVIVSTASLWANNITQARNTDLMLIYLERARESSLNLDIDRFLSSWALALVRNREGASIHEYNELLCWILSDDFTARAHTIYCLFEQGTLAAQDTVARRHRTLVTEFPVDHWHQQLSRGTFPKLVELRICGPAFPIERFTACGLRVLILHDDSTNRGIISAADLLAVWACAAHLEVLELRNALTDDRLSSVSLPDSHRRLRTLRITAPREDFLVAIAPHMNSCSSLALHVHVTCRISLQAIIDAFRSIARIKAGLVSEVHLKALPVGMGGVVYSIRITYVDWPDLSLFVALRSNQSPPPDVRWQGLRVMLSNSTRKLRLGDTYFHPPYFSTPTHVISPPYDFSDFIRNITGVVHLHLRTRDILEGALDLLSGFETLREVIVEQGPSTACLDVICRWLDHWGSNDAQNKTLVVFVLRGTVNQVQEVNEAYIDQLRDRCGGVQDERQFAMVEDLNWTDSDDED